MGKISRWLCLLILLISTPYLHAIEIGYVTEVDNQVELIRDGTVFALESGVAVSTDDIVKTGDEGIALIEMKDGSVFDIGPSSQLHLAQYDLEGNNQLHSSEVSLLTGWLRFITSRLNANRTFDIVTPTMTIGIRGTEGIIAIDENSSQMELTSGQVSVVGLDTLGNDFHVSRTIRTGEYIQHHRDGSAKHLLQSPDSFRQSKYPRFKTALVRKLQKLIKRGVLPKKLRKANVDDFKTLLQSNPRIRERLLKHLKTRIEDPEFRSHLKSYLKKNPKLFKKLKFSKAFRQATQQYSKEGKREQHKVKREKVKREKVKQEKVKQEKVKRYGDKE